MRRILYFDAKYYLNDNYKNVSNIALYVKVRGNSKFYLIVVLISLTTFSIPNNHNFGIGATMIIPNQNYLEDIDHYIESENTGKNYSLKVTLPDPYIANGNYSVIIVLNYLTFTRYGNVWDIGMDHFYSFWNDNNDLEDVIWVSLLEVEIDQDSWLDDTIYQPEIFFAFLEDELVPFIDNQYSVDEDNIYLSGSEYGGYFTLWAFFTYPESIIKHFISSEGNYDVNPDKLFDSEIAYYDWNSENVVTNRSLFVGVNLDHTSKYIPVASIMINLYYHGFQQQNIVFQEYSGDTSHQSISVDGWFYLLYQIIDLRFTTNNEISHNLGDIEELGFYVNQTIEFIFVGSMGFHEYELEWVANQDVIGLGQSINHTFVDVGIQNMTLNIYTNDNDTFSITHNYNVVVPPPPPFNFHTIGSTSLNTGSYKTQPTAEQNLSLNLGIVSIFLLGISIIRLRIKRIQLIN